MSKYTISSIQEQIEKQSSIMEELKLRLEALKKESPEEDLARELHSLLCTANHIDGCGWFHEIKNNKDNSGSYAKDNWDGYAHGKYLGKAKKIIHRCNELNISTNEALSMCALVR
jgi:uncharacterized damage-inducible protein DinB